MKEAKKEVTKKAVKKETAKVTKDDKIEVISFILKELESSHNKLKQEVLDIESGLKLALSRLGLQKEYKDGK